MTCIEESTFKGCSSLVSIEISPTVKNIEDYAFEGCSSLTSVVIPDSVISIGEGAFSGCSALTSAKLSNSITNIGERAFSGCSVLESVEIPNSVTDLGARAFQECSSLTSVKLSDALTGINDYSFLYCKTLSSLIIPNSIEKIENGAFSGCTNLKSVTIGTGVQSIRSSAFENAKPARVFWLSNTPPSGYQNVGGRFNYVSSNDYYLLKNKRVYPNLSSLFEVNDITYVPVDLAERTCDAIDCMISDEVIIVSNTVSYRDIQMTVQNIAPYFCYGNTNVRTVNIMEIKGEVGNFAFSDCTHLERAVFSLEGTIGEKVFSGCSCLAQVEMSEGVTGIGSNAFYGCEALTCLVCEAGTPPACSVNALADINKWTCKLHVPDYAVDTYKSAYQWKDFLFVQSLPTNIKSTVNDGAANDLSRILPGPVAVYTLTGQQLRPMIHMSSAAEALSGLDSGIYVLRGSDAACKVIKQ